MPTFPPASPDPNIDRERTLDRDTNDRSLDLNRGSAFNAPNSDRSLNPNLNSNSNLNSDFNSTSEAQRADPSDPFVNTVPTGRGTSSPFAYPASSVPPVFVSPFGWRTQDPNAPLTGPDLSASPNITPTHAIHRLTGELGELDIVNIKPPSDDFSGLLILTTPDDRSYYFANTGNIKRGFTVGPSRAVMLAFAGGFWYAIGQ